MMKTLNLANGERRMRVVFAMSFTLDGLACTA